VPHQSIEGVLARPLKALGLVTVAAIGLLMAACSTALILLDYKATVLLNDTADLRAECQVADSVKPELDWIGPGEAMLAHSGRYCAVHSPDGAYFGCVRRSAIAAANGGTVRVSESLDTGVNRSDCAGVRITGRFDPNTFTADLAWPSDAAQRGVSWIVMGYAIGGGLFVLAFLLVIQGRGPRSAATDD
jgi:hypothetical protein